MAVTVVRSQSMAEFPYPDVDRKAVRAAGQALREGGLSPLARQVAVAIVNQWRYGHGFPLNTFQVTLRNRAIRSE